MASIANSTPYETVIAVLPQPSATISWRGVLREVTLLLQPYKKPLLIAITVIAFVTIFLYMRARIQLSVGWKGERISITDKSMTNFDLQAKAEKLKEYLPILLARHQDMNSIELQGCLSDWLLLEGLSDVLSLKINECKKGRQLIVESCLTDAEVLPFIRVSVDRMKITWLTFQKCSRIKGGLLRDLKANSNLRILSFHECNSLQKSFLTEILGFQKLLAASFKGCSADLSMAALEDFASTHILCRPDGTSNVEKHCQSVLELLYRFQHEVLAKMPLDQRAQRTGAAGALVERIRREHAAGASILTGYSFLNNSRFDDIIASALISFANQECHSFVSLDISGTPISRASVEKLAASIYWEELFLNNRPGQSHPLPGEAFSLLQGIQHLRKLSFGSEKLGDEHLFSLDCWPYLTHLDLSYSENLTEVGIRFLGSCDTLKSFSVGGKEIGDGAVSAMASQFTDLQSLLLRECEKVTDQAIASIANFKRLSTLDLTGCYGVRGRNFYRLAQLPLETINCRGLVHLEDPAVIALLGLGTLKHLRLSRCSSLSNNALKRELSLPSVLESLFLDRCVLVDDAGIEALMAWARQLKSLSLSFTNVTDMGLSCLKEKGGSLESLNLSCCKSITGSGVKELGKLPRLKTLALRGCRLNQDILMDIGRKGFFNALRILDLGDAEGVDDEGIRNLILEQDIEELSLNNTIITDRALESLGLGWNHHLRMLNLSQCQRITSGGIRNLTRQDGLEELILDGCEGVDRAVLDILKECKNLKRLSLKGYPRERLSLEPIQEFQEQYYERYSRSLHVIY